jgi:hypothetical protein
MHPGSRPWSATVSKTCRSEPVSNQKLFVCPRPLSTPSFASTSRPSRDPFLLLDSQKNILFAKRTPIQPMFTGFLKKTEPKTNPRKAKFTPNTFFVSFVPFCAFLTVYPFVVQKKFFWKNEAKLCPSLLGFFKKQSQIEPKSNPHKATFRSV